MVSNSVRRFGALAIFAICCCFFTRKLLEFVILKNDFSNSSQRNQLIDSTSPSSSVVATTSEAGWCPSNSSQFSWIPPDNFGKETRLASSLRKGTRTISPPLVFAPLKPKWNTSSDISHCPEASIVKNIAGTCFEPGRSDVAVIFLHNFKAGGSSMRILFETW